MVPGAHSQFEYIRGKILKASEIVTNEIVSYFMSIVLSQGPTARHIFSDILF